MWRPKNSGAHNAELCSTLGAKRSSSPSLSAGSKSITGCSQKALPLAPITSRHSSSVSLLPKQGCAAIATPDKCSLSSNAVKYSMPRKPPILKKLHKEQERRFIANWVGFFNADPVEYLRTNPALKAEFAKIAHDPKAQKKLRESFQKLANAIKAVIIAYEDLWQGRAPKDGVKALRQAAQTLNELIEFQVTYRLGINNAGAVSVDPAISEVSSKLDFISDSIRRRVAYAVANFEDWLDYCQEHLPIGVCRYEKCQKFFVKQRKDERYCSPQHKNSDWVLKYRTRPGKYKSWR